VYRVALALMLGMALFLVAYGQFNGLPGHVDDSPSLAAVLQEALAACVSSDAGELCSFSRDYRLRAVTHRHEARIEMRDNQRSNDGRKCWFVRKWSATV